MPLSAEPWNWNPLICPADQDFIEWMLDHKREKWMAGTVLHLGPGAHHRVPRAMSNIGLECIGLTVSEDEHLWAPTLDGYRCILQNIWDFDPRGLEINFLTLFHIGEEAWKWGEIDAEKLDRLLEHMPKGGKVFFYARSAAFDRQLDYILSRSESSKPLRHSHQNKSVLVYEKSV